MQSAILHNDDIRPQLDSYLTASPFDEMEATNTDVDDDRPILDDDGYNDEDAAKIDAYDGYDEWTDAQKEHEPLPQPQDFMFRLYDDLQVWEIPSYGRIWLNREGTYSHNGPRCGLLKKSYEDLDDAAKNLIECVHRQADHEAAIEWDKEKSHGHYGGWR